MSLRDAFYGLSLLLAGCAGEIGYTDEELKGTPPDTCVPAQGGGKVMGCDPQNTKKTTVCHIPPGNPSNAHTLCVGTPAVPAHLAHGDYLGPCNGSPQCGGDDGGTTSPPPGDQVDASSGGAPDLDVGPPGPIQ